MGDLTEHFSEWEFRSCPKWMRRLLFAPKVPDLVIPNLKLLCHELEIIRHELGSRRMTITSGYRTAEHNARVDGAQSSRHLWGIAADFQVEGIEPAEVYEFVKLLFKQKKIKRGELKPYPKHTHYALPPSYKVWSKPGD